MNKFLVLGLVFTLYSCGISDKRNHQKVKEPRLFSESLSTLNGIALTRDLETIYISLQKEDTFENGRHAAGIFQSHLINGEWTSPTEINIKGIFDAYHPVLSANGRRLFFNSRSHPDSTGKYLKHDIWYIDWQPDDWSDPVQLPVINTPNYESYPSVAANGNLYFNSDRPGGKGGMDFYMSELKNGSYQTPVPLSKINSANEENDLVVDPQERFIIFNRYDHDTQSIDLWITFKESGEWNTPRKLDHINSADIWELTPSLDPSTQFFFWESESKIWQIDLDQLIYADELNIGKLSR